MSTIDLEFDRSLKGSRLTIYLIAAVILVFIIWARFAWLDQIVRSEGEVVSGAPPQIVQNLEGGILAEILVSEGDEVEPGQVLARLQTTQYQSSVDDLREQIHAAEVRKLRLEAEMAGESEFTVPDSIAAEAPEIVASERALLNARLADYNSRAEGAMDVMAETRRELASMEDMYSRQIVALLEVTKARKANTDAENIFNELVTSTELERADTYADTLRELSTLRQNLRIATDQLQRTTITSPMHGVVNNLNVATIGGVVRPGEEIFQITPLSDELFVEAKVSPKDIANVLPGQKATVKLSAYDYTIYGSLDAEVRVISADSFKDERRPELGAHYKVTLSVDLSDLDQRQQQIALRPGMQATVELHTGERTVLHYLTKPLYRSREALREP